MSSDPVVTGCEMRCNSVSDSAKTNSSKIENTVCPCSVVQNDMPLLYYIPGSFGGDGELVARLLARGVTWHPV